MTLTRLLFEAANAVVAVAVTRTMPATAKATAVFIAAPLPLPVRGPARAASGHAVAKSILHWRGSVRRSWDDYNLFAVGRGGQMSESGQSGKARIEQKMSALPPIATNSRRPEGPLSATSRHRFAYSITSLARSRIAVAIRTMPV